MMSKVIRIMSIEASAIERSNGNYRAKAGRKFRSTYNNTIGNSLYMRQLDKVSKLHTRKSAIKTKTDGDTEIQYTTALISVSFGKQYKVETDKPYKLLTHGDKIKSQSLFEWRVEQGKRALRFKYYNGSFTVNGIEYVRAIRSSSMSREGNCLFIRKDFAKDMETWSRMGVALQKKVDIASLLAYESLTLSSVKYYMTIKPHEILMIDDVIDYYTSKAHVTDIYEDDEGKPYIDAELMEEYPNRSDLFDGQSLMDCKLFERDGTSCKLLRSRWFKSAAFATDIQAFFRDNGIGEDDKIVDMFGNKRRAGDILLISTPNSLKFFKMYSDKGTGLSNQFASKADCYEYWLKKLKEEKCAFGVVKSESSSKFGNMQQGTYQLWNTLPCTYDELYEICKFDREYVYDIRSDLDKFREHIGESDIEDDWCIMDLLMATHSDIYRTKLFREWRGRVIEHYVKNLRRGKIKMLDADSIYSDKEVVSTSISRGWSTRLQ